MRMTVPRAVRRAAVVLTVSDFSAAAIAARYRVDPARIVVTPNGLDPRFGPDGPRPSRRPYVLVVGAIQPRKDPDDRGPRLRVPRRDDLDLLFVGPVRKDGAALDAAVDELGLADRVHRLGHVSEEELASLYRGAAAMIFPTRYEGFGLPALEGLASGAPLVASDIPPVREIVGEAGVLCPAWRRRCLRRRPASGPRRPRPVGGGRSARRRRLHLAAPWPSARPGPTGRHSGCHRAASGDRSVAGPDAGAAAQRSPRRPRRRCRGPRRRASRRRWKPPATPSPSTLRSHTVASLACSTCGTRSIVATSGPAAGRSGPTSSTSTTSSASCPPRSSGPSPVSRTC